MPKLLTILLSLFLTMAIQAKVTQVLELKLTFNQAIIPQNQHSNFKVTLFNEDFTDSLLLKPHNSCSELKNKWSFLNGKFIFINKAIPYRKVRVEHPDYITNTADIDLSVIKKDSTDTLNKYHHILFKESFVKLEKNCLQKNNFDYTIWIDGQPVGGYYYENLICVLFNDSLSNDSLKSIGALHELALLSTSHKNAIVIYKLNKGKLKPTKNKIIQTLLNDSLRIVDAGIPLDTSTYAFFSNKFKLCGLTLKQIEKLKFTPISSLKSLIKRQNYIIENELEMGCGLYKNSEGIAYDIITNYNEIRQQQLDNKCNDQKKLLALDQEFMVLKTKTFSISGGKDKNKKAEKNYERMREINEEQKELNKTYKAQLGFLYPVIISDILID